MRRHTLSLAFLGLFLAQASHGLVAYRDILVHGYDEIEPYAVYTSRWYSEENTSQPGRRYKTNLNDLYLSVPLFPTIEERNLSIQVRTSMRDLATAVLLPRSGERYPDPFFDIGAGLTYRWKMDRGREAGFAFALDGASDIPFNSNNDVSYRADLFYHRPINPGQAWVLYLHYRNDREYLRGIPLPGVGFLHRPNEFITVLFGAPYFLLEKRLTPSWTFRTEYEFPREVSAELSHQVFKPLTVYTDFNWKSENYFRLNSPRLHDRMTFREKRAGGGFRYALGTDVTFKMGGGYAFERYWYEGEDYSERHRDRVELDDAVYLEIGLRARF